MEIGQFGHQSFNSSLESCCGALGMIKTLFFLSFFFRRIVIFKLGLRGLEDANMQLANRSDLGVWQAL